MNGMVKVFESQDFGSIRMTEIDGEIWWVAADVCRALDVKNSRQALARLDDDEKGVILNDTLGGKQDMGMVNESGLYTLILGSRKPEAKAFKRWITHEVLPSIRKTGQYSVVTYEQIVRQRYKHVSASTVAADFKLSARKLNLMLEDLGIQYKDDHGIWRLADQYKDSGYAVYQVYPAPNAKPQLRWTYEGCLFIATLLAQYNIRPIIEMAA